MRRFDYILIVCITVLVIIIAFIYVNSKQNEPTAFVYNQKIFTQFKGTLELESKMKALEEGDRKIVDSLRQLIQSSYQQPDLKKFYEERLSSIDVNHRQVSEQFTSEVWKYINDGMLEYGKMNDYDFIFGASGGGNLMYAREGKDITNEVIQFLNAKYEGESVH